MGHFELAGSTIVLLLDSSVRKKLVFEESIRPALNGETEVEVQIGSVIGSVTK